MTLPIPFAESRATVVGALALLVVAWLLASRVALAQPAPSGSGVVPAPSASGVAPAPSGSGVAPASAPGVAPTPSGSGVAPAPSGSAPPAGSSAAPSAPPPGVVVPKLVTAPDVPYPEGAKGDATVALTVVVAKDGTVREATPTEENKPFSDVAAEKVKTFVYEPATRNGVPIVAKIRIEIVFREPPPPPPPPRVALAPPLPKGLPPMVIEQVDVRGLRAEAGRTASLSRAEVRQVPGTFGDPFRAVEIMPGVTPIVSGLPYFFIRGAPPGNVGYFLDGLRVPVLFHVGAGPSVIHPALVKQVDLYPGGYPARFGRFAGGIVAGEMQDPLERPHGEFNLRLFDVGAFAETPFADGRGSVAVGGRYSYTGALFSLFSPSTILDYWDYQGRATFDLTPDDRISVFAMGSYDFLGQTIEGVDEPLTLFGAEFHRLDFRYDHRIGNRGRLRSAFTLGIDKSRISQERNTRDRLIGTRTDMEYRLSPEVLLRAGSDAQIDSYDVQTGQADLGPSGTTLLSLFPSRADFVLGARADVVLTPSPRFEVVPGIRADLFASQGATAVGIDPRLATRTKVSDRVSVLAAAGLAHQAPAFVVPVPGFTPGGIRGGLQKAVQQSLGLELAVMTDTTFTATLFHNGFFDMSDPLGATAPQPPSCPPGAFPRDTLAGDRGAGGGGGGGGGTCGARFPQGTIGTDRSGGGGQGSETSGNSLAVSALEVRTRGRSYGMELFLKKRLTSRVGGFFSYTLSRSTRTFENREYTATFDRTHVLNVALAFDLGHNWRAGTRVVFYTGVPQATDPSAPSTSRLPAFFRVDLRLEKRWNIGKTAWLSVVAEWLNATLTKESIAQNCTLAGCTATYIGPVTIPSIGLEGGI